MPRNKILPPVSFVTDLSNSGNSLIQNLFDKPLQETNGDRPRSFGERLRSQSVDSQRDRTSTTVAPKPVQQNRETVSRTERLELPRRRPPENRIAESRVYRDKSDDNLKTSRAESSLNPTPTSVTEDEAVNRTERSSDDSSQSVVQQPAPADSQDRIENEEEQGAEELAQQPGVEIANEDSDTGEVPATLVKHVIESIRQNGELADAEDNRGLQADEATLPPAVLSGLANALQGQVPVQQEVDKEQASAIQDEETAQNIQQGNSTSNSQQQGDPTEEIVAAIDPEVTDQNSQLNEQTSSESNQQKKAVIDTELAAQAVSEQVSPTGTEVISELNADTKGTLEQDTGSSRQSDVVNEQAESSHNQNVNGEQEQLDDASSDRQVSQGLKPVDQSENAGSGEVVEESSQQQKPASAAVGNTVQQGREKDTEVIQSVSVKELPADETATQETEENSSNSESGQVSSTTGAASQYTQQYGQAVSEGTSSSKQSNDSNVSRVIETSAVDKLSEVVGQVSVNETTDGFQTQKSVQIDSLSAASTTAARSSGETPATAQARPVLDMTRSDMSQKLSSFIQQASESGKAMRIRLDPPELGSLQIEVGRVNGQIVARIEVDNPTARALVFEQLQMLRDSLQQQGLRVDRLEVEINENLSREFGSDQSAEQRSEEQQQRFAEETDFAAESKQGDQNGQAEDEANLNPQNTQVIGVSEIDVQI